MEEIRPVSTPHTLFLRFPMRRFLRMEQLEDRCNPSSLHILPFDRVQPDANHTVPVTVQLDNARFGELVPVRVEVGELPHRSGAPGYATAWDDFVPLRYNTVLAGYRGLNRITIPVSILGDRPVENAEGLEAFRVTVTPLHRQWWQYNLRAVSTNVYLRDVVPPPQAPHVVAPLSATINEGGVFNGTYSFSDRDGGPWNVRVHFDDGSSDLVLNNVMQPGAFNLAKRFDDDGIFHGSITVTDNNGLAGTAPFTVSVLNVAPVVNAGPDVTVFEGKQPNVIPMTGSFTDPGRENNYWSSLFYVRRSDTGALVESGGVAVNPVTHTLSYSAVQLKPGDYTVTLEVRDNKARGFATTHIHVLENPTPPPPPAVHGIRVDAGPDVTAFEGLQWPNSFDLTGKYTDDTANVDWYWAIFYVYRVDTGALVEDGGCLVDRATGSVRYSAVQLHYGDYRIKLEVHNGVGVGFDEMILHVLPNAAKI